MGESIAGADGTRDAAHQRSWAETYEALSTRDASELSPRDLEALADAAWWLSRMEESIAARQRAYTTSASAGDAEHAAGMAARLSIEHFMRGDPAIGAGWLMKAQRHAEEVPEGVGHGLLLIVEARVARFGGDMARAKELVDRAVELGRRFGDPDLMAMAIHTTGRPADPRRRRCAWSGAHGRSDGQRRVGPAEPVLHRHRLLRRDRHLPGARRCPPSRPMERGRTRLVRNAPARVSVPRDVPRQPRRGREAPRRMGRSRSRSDAGVRGADGLRPDGSGASDLRDGRDPTADRQPGRRRGVFRARQRDRLRPAARAGPPPVGAGQHGRGAQSAPGRRDRGRGESAPARSAARRLGGRRDRGAGLRDRDGGRGPTVGARRRIRRSDPGGHRRRRPPAPCPSRAGRHRLPSRALRRACAMWRDLRLPYEAARARMVHGLALRASGDEDGAQLELRSAVSAFERLGATPEARVAGDLLPGAASASREGSRRGRPRCSGCWPPASRTATSPPRS